MLLAAFRWLILPVDDTKTKNSFTRLQEGGALSPLCWLLINEREVWHLRLFTGESAVVGFMTLLCKKKSWKYAPSTSCLHTASVRNCFHTDVCTFHTSCRCNVRLCATLLWSHPSLFDDWYVCLLRLEYGEAPCRSYRGRRPDGGATCLTLQPSFFEWSPPDVSSHLPAVRLPPFVIWSNLDCVSVATKAPVRRQLCFVWNWWKWDSWTNSLSFLLRHFSLFTKARAWKGNYSQTWCNESINSIKGTYFPDIIQGILTQATSFYSFTCL